MTTDVFVRAEDVSNALHERLAAISVANGFETDIGLKLFKGRRKIPADHEVPCTFLIEGRDFPVGQQTTRVRNKQPYVVWAFGPCDADNPNVAAHAMIRDLKRAIWGGKPNLDGRCRSLSYEARDIGPRPDGVAIVQVELTFAVEYAEDLSKP